MLGKSPKSNLLYRCQQPFALQTHRQDEGNAERKAAGKMGMQSDSALLHPNYQYFPVKPWTRVEDPAERNLRSNLRPLKNEPAKVEPGLLKAQLLALG